MKSKSPIYDIVSSQDDEKFSMGQRVADRVAETVGSWKFIIIQSIIISIWITLNSTGILTWDPYPFILLNLTLSFQAAYTAPIIMMSQNRQEEKDRKRAEADFQVNLIAEKQIEIIQQEVQAITSHVKKTSSIKAEIGILQEELKNLRALLEQQSKS